MGNRVFWNYEWKNLVIRFFWICSVMKVYTLAVFLHKRHIWGNSGSQVLSQNVLSQSACSIFISAIYPEQINEIAFLLYVDADSWKIKACWKFMGGHGQKWVRPRLSRNSKIGCISGMNGWNKLIFCRLIQIQES